MVGVVGFIPPPVSTIFGSDNIPCARSGRYHPLDRGSLFLQPYHRIWGSRGCEHRQGYNGCPNEEPPLVGVRGIDERPRGRSDAR